MKKQSSSTAEATPDAQQVKMEREQRPIAYVVVREGFRVSEKEYTTSDDPAALHEKEFWTKVAQGHSYGEPVEIVQYDSKKHRVFDIRS